MRLIQNAGRDRVLDLLNEAIERDARLDLCSQRFSLFAFAALEQRLEALANARILLPGGEQELELLGTAADRAARNRLDAPWLARQCFAPRLEADAVEAVGLGIVAWGDELAPEGEVTCSRDSAFADDVAKANLAAILEQHDITTVRSL